MSGLETYVYCCNEFAYPSSLTYARRYLVVAEDLEKSLIRVMANTGRTRWFPSYCFRTELVPLLLSWQFDDEPVEDNGFVEISLKFFDGSVRWTFLATPGMLLDSFQHRDYLEGRGMLLVSKIEESLVGRVLQEMEPEGRLLHAETFQVLEPRPEDVDGD